MTLPHSMKTTLIIALISAVASGLTAVNAADLTLLDKGKTDYQIVIPDPSGDPLLDETMRQIGRLVQAAFKENGGDAPIVVEKDKTPDKPGIYLGDTAFARANGVKASKLADWNYVLKAVEPNVIIAGRDHAPPDLGDTKNLGYVARFFYRFGTLKGAADFLRQYAGARFLYPDGNGIPLKGQSLVRDWTIRDNAAIAFVKALTIKIPADLDLHKKVFTRYHTRSSSANTIYDVANNFFPKVDDALMGHTYGRAVPRKTYWKDHPEYFLLIGGKRTKGAHNPHYCVSNPEFQEILFRWTKSFLDKGCRSVNMLQPDGFRPCQCAKCAALYDTGSDWGEKLWIMQRNIAERILKEHPDKKVLLTAYTVTQSPPERFESFPDNVIIQNVDAINAPTETFKEWKAKHDGEYSCWLHNWIGNLVTRYTPMKTPRFTEKQAKFFYDNNIRGVFRDGRGEAFGLEGPTYYVFGRMLDDPENLTAKELVFEFCDAAFGAAGPDMRRFYDKLYHGIEVYSEFLGTHCPGWTYKDIYGRGHKHLSDPFRLLGFLYPPKLLKQLEIDLSRAEKKADSDLAKSRLTLVRREFDWIKSLAKVIHLYEAYEFHPDRASRDRLLDAIDERNAMIDGYYDYIASRDKGKSRYDRPKPMPGWKRILFPPGGHNAKHMRLGYNRYQEPFANTAVNWDTDAVRKSPLPNSEKMTVKLVDGPVSIDSTLWKNAPAITLQGFPVDTKPSTQTTVKTLCDGANLHVLTRSELGSAATTFESVGEDGNLDERESIDVFIAPDPGRDVYYRFRVGPNPESKYDAATGLITDVLNLLHGKEDLKWDGEWTYESDVDAKSKRWTALLTIPLKTIGAEPPKPDDFWRGNFGRIQRKDDGSLDKSIWSASASTRGVSDVNAIGDLLFDGGGNKEKKRSKADRVRNWRVKYYKKTFDIPKRWKNLPNPLPNPLGPWLFRADPLEHGVKEKWHKANIDESKWTPIPVPAFWDETDVGPLQAEGWYRTTFKIPADWKGKGLRIMVGSADEEAWVYLNGELVKEHTIKSTGVALGNIWETPFSVDLKPDQLNVGGDNLLVIRVKNTKANGGLWRPVIARAVEPE